MRNSRFVSCRICRGCGKKTPVRSTPARLFSSGTPQAPGYQDFSVVTIFFPPPSQATRPELQGGHPPPIPLRPQKRHPREGDTPRISRCFDERLGSRYRMRREPSGFRHRRGTDHNGNGHRVPHHRVYRSSSSPPTNSTRQALSTAVPRSQHVVFPLANGTAAGQA